MAIGKGADEKVMFLHRTPVQTWGEVVESQQLTPTDISLIILNLSWIRRAS